MLQFLLHVSIHNMQCMISLPFLCVLLPVHPMPVLYLNKCTYRHTFFEILVGDTSVRGLTRGLATSKVQPGDLRFSGHKQGWKTPNKPPSGALFLCM